MSLRVLAAGVFLSVLPSAAPAQSWNTPEVRGPVERAIARRTSVQADSGLQSFRARAHGFVFFLGQLGEGFSEPPRLVKSDQLALEVYWRAPNLSKQIILGRRDRRDLPTDVQYHRDHLGIVQNNFGDQIRFGDGDEVKDVPHPLGPGGEQLYDYALVDSLTIELPDRTVRVYQILVRPRDFAQARVIGTMFIDVESAELVRFWFSFTPPSYLDTTLEDITVVLDNGLWFGRYWLPRRQEIEIRRRTSWLDLPARGIIRGRWEIGSYEFNVEIPPAMFAAREPEIVYAPQAVRDSFPWDGKLGAAIDSVLGPVERADLDEVRGQLVRAAASRALTGLPSIRPAFGSISDVLHVNRVEGLAAGLGWVWRFAQRRVELRAWGSYGFSDERAKARGSVQTRLGRVTLELRAAREIRDVGDEPVISRLVNSFLAQERGFDFGDYVLLDEGAVTIRRGGPARQWAFSLGAERANSVTVTGTPATGGFRPNAALGGPAHAVGRLDLTTRFRRGEIGLALEGGVSSGTRRYGRFRFHGEAAPQLGPVQLGMSGWSGWGSPDLPPHRLFVIGGRGSLMGEPFRAWGGRYGALGRLALRIPVPFVAIPLGGFGSTGASATLSPFIAGGWVAGTVTGAAWTPAPHLRPVAGVQLDLLHGMLRTELGMGLRDRRLGLSVDIQRNLWPIL